MSLCSWAGEWVRSKQMVWPEMALRVIEALSLEDPHQHMLSGFCGWRPYNSRAEWTTCGQLVSMSHNFLSKEGVKLTDECTSPKSPTWNDRCTHKWKNKTNYAPSILFSPMNFKQLEEEENKLCQQENNHQWHFQEKWNISWALIQMWGSTVPNTPHIWTS